MSVTTPNSILITPRQQIVQNTSGAPTGYIGSGSTWLDITCSFTTYNQAERESFYDHQNWTEHSWLTPAGLGDFTAKRLWVQGESFIKVKHDGERIMNTNIAYEAQYKQSAYPLSCLGVTTGTWSSVAGCPLPDSINLVQIDPYTQYKYDSGRVSRDRRMLGVMGKLTAGFILNEEGMGDFITWYRCNLSSDTITFTADWLTSEELGTWTAHWAEPWKATYNNDYWRLDITLVVTQ